MPHYAPSSTASFPIRPVSVSPSIILAQCYRQKTSPRSAYPPLAARCDATSPTGNVGVWEGRVGGIGGGRVKVRRLTIKLRGINILSLEIFHCSCSSSRTRPAPDQPISPGSADAHDRCRFWLLDRAIDHFGRSPAAGTGTQSRVGSNLRCLASPALREPVRASVRSCGAVRSSRVAAIVCKPVLLDQN